MDIFLNSKYIKQEMQKLYKQASSSTFECYFPPCKKNAVESHILQRNGILSDLTTDSHLYVLKKPDFYTPKSYLKRVGLKNALSYPLFCEEHDNEIFKSVEKRKYNIYHYLYHLLFSYRTVLAEQRKKEIMVKYFQSILDSSRLKILAPDLNRSEYEKQVYSFQLGVKDIEWYKFMIELELFTENNKRNFTFKIMQHNPVKVCVSAFFSPVSAYDFNIHNPDKIPSSAIVNVFSHNKNLNIILGSCVHLPNAWITNYFNSWDNLPQQEVELKISDLIATRTDTWALSPIHAENNPKINFLLEYWDNNMYNLDENQSFNHNIFQNN